MGLVITSRGYSISLGIPFANKEIFFYLKGMYFQKSGNPIIYHYEYNDWTGESNTYTSQESDVTITWHQLLVNIGIQYDLKFGLSNNLIFNGDNISKACAERG